MYNLADRESTRSAECGLTSGKVSENLGYNILNGAAICDVTAAAWVSHAVYSGN
jgi:hypothetical protein